MALLSAPILHRVRARLSSAPLNAGLEPSSASPFTQHGIIRSPGAGMAVSGAIPSILIAVAAVDNRSRLRYRITA
jgi:hypothetical protein